MSNALTLSLLLLTPNAPSGSAPAAVTVKADPPSVRLIGASARQQLLIEGADPAGVAVDLTRQARYRALDPAVATVSPAGVVRPAGDGRTTVEIDVAGVTRSVAVAVEGAKEARTFHFENDVVPVLSKLGCNASGCHGKAEGQNGFKLSVFGFDPAADHEALTRESRGRRVFPADPGRSLLLQKISGDVPHGGGVRAGHDSDDYETLRAWVAAGTPFGRPDDPKVAIRVEPRARTFAGARSQQLRVTARDSRGREFDVTAHSKFQSNYEATAAVDEHGLVTAGAVPGDAAVMAAYLGSVDVFRAVIPRPGAPAADRAAVADVGATNPIDAAVLRKLRLLNIEPSGPCTDSDYLRRVYLDVIGTLPTPDEARRFLADTRPDRRARLVDALLQRPEYADFWALRWSDLLRVDREALGHKRAFGFYRWVRARMADDTPLDRFARALITAEGPLDESGPANFYKVVTKPGEAAGALAQVFLGVRIACAECHHHPYDRWGQDDYYGMQAYFSPLALRGAGRAEALLATGDALATNPRTGLRLTPRPLGADPTPSSPGADPREALAAWITAPENPYFARNLANRYWAHFLGRGLVEPVDDARGTNPPANPELLDALAAVLVASRFDPHALIRAITGSAAYQRSSRPNETNAGDERNDSRARLRRVGAEVLLDMVCQTTGVPETFAGVPPGSRAVQLWDSKVSHYFLRTFGRPVRATTCECERDAEPGVGQVLHLLNAPEIHAKLTHEAGTIARLVRRHPADADLADELYLTFLSRFPTADERAAAVAHLSHTPSRRRDAAEDLAWGLLNTLEFLFNH